MNVTRSRLFGALSQVLGRSRATIGLSSTRLLSSMLSLHRFKPTSIVNEYHLATSTTQNPQSEQTDSLHSSPINVSKAVSEASDLSKSDTTPIRLTLRYHVSRTPTNNLPVYSEFKAHRTLKLTIVKKIAGDSHALRDDLEKELGLNNKTCFVKHPTGHVVLKGVHKPKILEFLQQRGF
jgi:large subunit ribosomal protein L49